MSEADEEEPAGLQGLKLRTRGWEDGSFVERDLREGTTDRWSLHSAEELELELTEGVAVTIKQEVGTQPQSTLPRSCPGTSGLKCCFACLLSHSPRPSTGPAWGSGHASGKGSFFWQPSAQPCRCTGTRARKVRAVYSADRCVAWKRAEGGPPSALPLPRLSRGAGCRARAHRHFACEAGR
jgi:hypothetical protein